MIIKLLQKRNNRLAVRVVKIDPDSKGYDFYEKIALKLGWKEDIDALWYLSSKGIVQIEKVEDFEQQSFSFIKPIIDCLRPIGEE
ncbi:MAG: hypothetical protein UHM08_02285 [Bacteroidales bacterium]|nr:hypothetical protein [Bacteroidales bacterium]